MSKSFGPLAPRIVLESLLQEPEALLQLEVIHVGLWVALENLRVRRLGLVKIVLQILGLLLPDMSVFKDRTLSLRFSFERPLLEDALPRCRRAFVVPIALVKRLHFRYLLQLLALINLLVLFAVVARLLLHRSVSAIDVIPWHGLVVRLLPLCNPIQSHMRMQVRRLPPCATNYCVPGFAGCVKGRQLLATLTRLAVRSWPCLRLLLREAVLDALGAVLNDG